jgi:hypothetical protein
MCLASQPPHHAAWRLKIDLRKMRRCKDFRSSQSQKRPQGDYFTFYMLTSLHFYMSTKYLTAASQNPVESPIPSGCGKLQAFLKLGARKSRYGSSSSKLLIHWVTFSH